MSYRAQAHRPQRGGCCLQRLMSLLVIMLLLAAVYIWFVRPRLSAYVGQQVSTIGQTSDPQVQSDPQAQIEDRIEQGLPAAIAALPPGEVTVTAEQANTYIDGYTPELDLVDDATVRFIPGQVQADVQALGAQSRFSAELSAQNGQFLLTNPRIDGPLGIAISAESLADTLQRQVNDELAVQGQQVREVRVEQDQIILVTE